MNHSAVPFKTIRLRYDFDSQKWRSTSISHKVSDGISRCGKYAIYTLCMVPGWLSRSDVASSLSWVVPPTNQFFLNYDTRHQWAPEKLLIPLALPVKELEPVLLPALAFKESA